MFYIFRNLGYFPFCSFDSDCSIITSKWNISSSHAPLGDYGWEMSIRQSCHRNFMAGSMRDAHNEIVELRHIPPPLPTDIVSVHSSPPHLQPYQSLRSTLRILVNKWKMPITKIMKIMINQDYDDIRKELIKVHQTILFHLFWYIYIY